jgi:cytochrome P450
MQKKPLEVADMPNTVLPVISTQTAEFMRDPNGLIGRGADRLTVAQGDYGVELLSYDLVQRAFLDKRLGNRTADYFARLGASAMVREFVTEGNFNMFPKEKHARIRRLSVTAFNARGFDGARRTVHELADDLLESFIDRGHCNLTADFTHHLSIGGVAAFVGIAREDVPTFDHATVELRLLGQIPIGPGLPRLDAALATLKDYGGRLIEAKRRKPGDDYLSDLIAARDERGQMSELELIWSVANVLLAGHDTTRYQLASLARAVIEAGEWERLFTKPELIPAAVDEGMRFYPATPRQTKIAGTSVEFGGVSFDPGDVIVLNMSAAGRDPARFDNPDAFIIGREPGSKIGFGLADHLCLGQLLARAELEEGIRVLTSRLTDVVIDGPIEMKPTGTIAGIEVLPLRFRRRSDR